METHYYQEMVDRCRKLDQEGALENKRIFLFGHCSATEELAGLLMDMGYSVAGILDNHIAKQGKACRGIPIVGPERIPLEEETIVCIATRFYEAMHAQLRRIGFKGKVYKLIDYNTYAEYSLSDEALERKRKRVAYGKTILGRLEEKYPNYFRVYCPFGALGDVYFCMSYLPYLLEKRGRTNYLMLVPGNACAKVAKLFDDCPVEVMEQGQLDALIQAELYLKDENAFIAHQDRPYVVNLFRALYCRKMTLEQIYRCGVFGLWPGTKPVLPQRGKTYKDLESIERNQAVILSPYAKSVTLLQKEVWMEIAGDYKRRGFQVFTNVAGEEKPLPGTLPISPDISEIRSAAERAGTFIGIRSGICDVLKEADCRKVALYPDYHYCDTRWKAIDIYALEGWENMVVKDGFQWKGN